MNVLRDILPFKDYVNIKTLKLRNCFLFKNTLIEILNNCEILEKFTLHHSSYMSIKVRIHQNWSY